MEKTISKRAHKLSAANRRFHALSPADRRVAVAKDVIKQLKLRTINPQSANWYIFVDDSLDQRENEQFDKVFKELAAKGEKELCTVCGIGACMVSFANLGDKHSVSDLTSCKQDDIRQMLKGTFTENQLHLIEAAFEEDFCVPKAADFGSEYYNDDTRLEAIMLNIIKNKGTFKP